MGGSSIAFVLEELLKVNRVVSVLLGGNTTMKMVIIANAIVMKISIFLIIYISCSALSSNS